MPFAEATARLQELIHRQDRVLTVMHPPSASLARVMEAANAGELVLDHELSGARIAQSIFRALENPQRLEEMEENSYQLGNRDATEKVRQICMDLLEDANPKSGHAGKTQGNYVLSCF